MFTAGLFFAVGMVLLLVAFVLGYSKTTISTILAHVAAGYLCIGASILLTVLYIAGRFIDYLIWLTP